MEKEIKIDIPQGMIVDVENSDLVNGVIKFKEKPHVQKKWEDFGEVEGWYIDMGSCVSHCEHYRSADSNRKTLPTKSLADAMLALCQLLQWRNKVWKEDGDWTPYFTENGLKSCIYTNYNKIEVHNFVNANRILAFRTEELRDKFLKDHKDLIEQAKELL